MRYIVVFAHSTNESGEGGGARRDGCLSDINVKGVEFLRQKNCCTNNNLRCNEQVSVIV